jgi:hypothetical protein
MSINPCQLARGGDRNDRAAFAAGFQARPGAMQAPLRAPRDRYRLGRLALLAICQRAPQARRGARRGTTSARCLCGSFSDAALPNPA